MKPGSTDPFYRASRATRFIRKILGLSTSYFQTYEFGKMKVATGLGTSEGKAALLIAPVKKPSISAALGDLIPGPPIENTIDIPEGSTFLIFHTPESIEGLIMRLIELHREQVGDEGCRIALTTVPSDQAGAGGIGEAH